MVAKVIDKCAASSNRVYVPKGKLAKCNQVYMPEGRLAKLVALEVATAYQEIMADWGNTLGRQLRLVALYEMDKEAGVAGRNWSKVPNVDWVDGYFEARLVELHEHYAKVRVVELPQEGKRFVLVYGDIDNSKVKRGTGPFATKEEAWMWFLNGGR